MPRWFDLVSLGGIGLTQRTTKLSKLLRRAPKQNKSGFGPILSRKLHGSSEEIGERNRDAAFASARSACRARSAFALPPPCASAPVFFLLTPFSGLN